MIPRVFWIALGAGAGVLVVRRVQANLRKVTPAGIADRAGASAQDAGDRAAGWWETVRGFAAEREAELRESLGLDELTFQLPGLADRAPGDQRADRDDRAAG